MSKVSVDLIVLNSEGLHARPAMQFVDVANRFAAAVTVTKDDEVVDGTHQSDLPTRVVRSTRRLE